MAIANRLLTAIEDFGESRENLEENWEQWIHRMPFDAPVARALGELYERRLKSIDKEKEAAEYQRLNRKLRLVSSRAARYDLSTFPGESEERAYSDFKNDQDVTLVQRVNLPIHEALP